MSNISIGDFHSASHRYVVYEADDAEEAAHAEDAIDKAGPRYKHSGTGWRGDVCIVAAGVLEMDELFSLTDYTHRGGEGVLCTECDNEYTGTVVEHNETGERLSNCPHCGQSFTIDDD